MIPFHKLHGLGNDFIVFVALPPHELTDRQLEQLVSHAPQLCDRHEGVGADGLLLVLPAGAGGADARMRVINADGSEPETCGNGLRCVAKALREHVSDFADRDALVIETGGGLVSCTIQPPPPSPVERVRIYMGRARHEASHDRLAVEGLDETFRGTVINIGNPHLVLFFDDPGQDLRRRALAHGPLLERHQSFPARINVGFAHLRPRDAKMELWVWERGCGLTRACGSGACAAAAATVVTGRWMPDATLGVQLPGGTLDIEVSADLSVQMEGPAVEVFAGELSLLL